MSIFWVSTFQSYHHLTVWNFFTFFWSPLHFVHIFKVWKRSLWALEIRIIHIREIGRLSKASGSKFWGVMRWTRKKCRGFESSLWLCICFKTVWIQIQISVIYYYISDEFGCSFMVNLIEITQVHYWILYSPVSYAMLRNCRQKEPCHHATLKKSPNYHSNTYCEMKC